MIQERSQNITCSKTKMVHVERYGNKCRSDQGRKMFRMWGFKDLDDLRKSEYDPLRRTWGSKSLRPSLCNRLNVLRAR